MSSHTARGKLAAGIAPGVVGETLDVFAPRLAMTDGLEVPHSW